MKDDKNKVSKISPAKLAALSWIGFPSNNSEPIVGMGFMDFEIKTTNTVKKNIKPEKESRDRLNLSQNGAKTD